MIEPVILFFETVHAGIIDTAGNSDRVCADILHVERNAFTVRQVPLPTRRFEHDAGPFFLVKALDTQGRTILAGQD